MCRLVAYVGAPVSPAPLVFDGTHPLVEQSWAPRELLSGSVNADGYGVVWYHAHRPRRIAEARPIWQEPDLRDTLDALASPCVVAALRNVTPGIPADRSGLLPLVHDRWCFVLNGFVPDFRSRHMRRLRSALRDDLYAALVGSSDSETLFLLAVQEVGAGVLPGEALATVARRVVSEVADAEAQLTMVLVDGERVGAVRSGTRAATNSLYLARGHGLAPAGILLASERLDGDPRWEAVPPHHRVELTARGDVEIQPL
jgi:gamma-glutamyl hercynylcysteine S-oxide hydrolase